MEEEEKRNIRRNSRIVVHRIRELLSSTSVELQLESSIGFFQDPTPYVPIPDHHQSSTQNMVVLPYNPPTGAWIAHLYFRWPCTPEFFSEIRSVPSS